MCNKIIVTNDRNVTRCAISLLWLILYCFNEENDEKFFLYAFSLAIYSQTLIKCNQTKKLSKGVKVQYFRLQAASARHFILIFYCVFCILIFYFVLKFGNPLVAAQYNSKEASAYITIACPSVNKPLNVPFLMSTRLTIYFSTNGIFSFSLLSGR